MVKHTLTVFSLHDLCQWLADYLNHRAKEAQEKANKLDGNKSESYRLVANEFTDAADFLRKLEIELEPKRAKIESLSRTGGS